MANQSFTGDTSHHAILDVYVGERGEPVFIPARRLVGGRCGRCLVGFTRHDDGSGAEPVRWSGAACFTAALQLLKRTVWASVTR